MAQEQINKTYSSDEAVCVQTHLEANHQQIKFVHNLM